MASYGTLIAQVQVGMRVRLRRLHAAEQFARWAEFDSEVFGIDVDAEAYNNLLVKAPANTDATAWQLVVVPCGFTVKVLLRAIGKKCECDVRLLEGAAGPFSSLRTPERAGYCIFTESAPESRLSLRDKSATEVKELGGATETLLECLRLDLFRRWYQAQSSNGDSSMLSIDGATPKHKRAQVEFVNENTNLCPATEFADGTVAGVCWRNGGKNLYLRAVSPTETTKVVARRVMV